MPNRGYIWTIAAGCGLVGFCLGHGHALQTMSASWFIMTLIGMWTGGFTYHLLREKTMPVT